MGTIRLDKYLADMQVGTRSQVKDYIRKKRIRVNGELVTSPEYKLDTALHKVTFDNNPIDYVEEEYYMLNKPAGVLSATTDKNAKTVLDLIDCARKDLFPVGRLDKDTEGLLIITNDGVLAHDLLSPKKHVDKVYYAKVAGIIGEDIVEKFRQGLVVDDSLTALPANLEIIGRCKVATNAVKYETKSAADVVHASSDNLSDTENDISEIDATEVYVTIREGKFHQIKRMFIAVGSEVLYLKRLSMGSVKLDEKLKPGEYRPLTDEELKSLRELQNR